MDTSKKTPATPAAMHTPTATPDSASPQAPAASTAAGPAAARTRLASRPEFLIPVVCAVLVVTALAIPRYASRHAVPATDNAQPPAPASSVQNAATQPVSLSQPVAAPLQVATVPAPVAKTVTEKPRQTRIVTTKKSASANVVSVHASGAGESAARTVVAAPIPRPSVAEASATIDHVGPAPVTISGCLETTTDGDRFRLTDTEGADAPKSRGWRSGFLKKSSAPVELLELSAVPNLRTYVGHRVSATGVLTSREMRVRSLESTGPSCN